jgi:hypothetical protein
VNKSRIFRPFKLRRLSGEQVDLQIVTAILVSKFFQSRQLSIYSPRLCEKMHVLVDFKKSKTLQMLDLQGFISF